MSAQQEYRAVYLRSAHWREMRQLALEDAGHRCAVCNSPKRLDVHHRTYERLGNERLTDLLVLCRLCHDVFHKHRRLTTSQKPKAKKQQKPKTAQPPATVRVLDATNARRRRSKDQQRLVRDGLASPTT